MVSVLWDSKKSKLRESGILVDGIIFDQDFDYSVHSSTTDSYSPVKDKIIVRFVKMAELMNFIYYGNRSNLSASLVF